MFFLAWKPARRAILSLEISIGERIFKMKHRILPLRRLFAAVLLALALCIQTAAAMPERLVPCGMAAGIRLYTDGLLITALEEQTPAQRAGLRAGDTITEIDGMRVSSVTQAMERLSGGKSVRVSVRRGGRQAEFYLTPEKTQSGYRLGLFVRDNISGIGTITFYDPETGVYGALGHGVNGLSGAKALAISGGVLVPASVAGVRKGVRGTPGELQGSFDVSRTLGSVLQNEPHGIFGTLDQAPDGASVPVADVSQIHTGAAVILANVDGTTTQEYCVRIEKLYPQAENGRNLLLTVTDERLLEKTGGIVQGMSGSPILQDGRLIGAVTYVLVNRPEEGYGIFMQSMLGQCQAYS